MADYLVDTYHLSRLVADADPLRKRLLRRLQMGDSFSIAVPALTELLYGLQTAPRARQNMLEWMSLNVVFNYYEIEQQDAEQAAALQVDLLRDGWQLFPVDALIATVALRYNLILLSTDNDFSRITPLQVENWLKQ